MHRQLAVLDDAVTRSKVDSAHVMHAWYLWGHSSAPGMPEALLSSTIEKFGIASS